MHRNLLRNALGLALALALLGAPGAALGQKPPDNGAVDEYTEGVPGAKGETPSGSQGGRGALDETTVDDLAAAGSDGSAAARLAQATAPDSKALRKAARKAQRGEAEGSGAAAETESGGAAGVFDAVVVSTDDGMGAALPGILAAAVFAAFAVLLWRRRLRGDQSTG